MKEPIISNETDNKEERLCKNCGTKFLGKYCPECGQSIKEFERPFQFLIIDFMGNMFAFDTRFWKTLVAVLFKPGKLALDYVKGHRVKYMPPFRFYVFVSFIFFFLLNIFTARNPAFGNLEIKPQATTDTISVVDSTALAENKQIESTETKYNSDNVALYNDHPEMFFEKLWKYISWVMFLLMPFYGFLLWLFYRKVYKYYITHFIMAINQHAFIFVVLTIMLLLSLFLHDFSKPFVN